MFDCTKTTDFGDPDRVKVLTRVRPLLSGGPLSGTFQVTISSGDTSATADQAPVVYTSTVFDDWISVDRFGKWFTLRWTFNGTSGTNYTTGIDGFEAEFRRGGRF